jgi:APA family basic amino acid/polyamine antiporter
MTEQTQTIPRPALSLTEGIALVVGIVIGIGIFKTPSLIANNVESEAAFIGVWVLGGLVTLIGALCYAELAAAYPHSGGEYHFLSRAYGRPVAILFGWARGTVIQPGAIAAIGFVLGDYAQQLYGLGANGPAIYAAMSVILFTALNVAGTSEGRWTQLVLTTLTVAAIGAVILVPLGVSPMPPSVVQPVSGSLGLAMILVLLTYGGWNEAAYLSAEMREKRDTARTLIYGTLILTVIYVLVNVALVTVFGLQGLRQSSAPGADLMRHAFGGYGALLLSAIVVATASSTMNGTVFTGGRIYYALGQDLPLLRRLGRWDEQGQNPRNGILLQGLFSLALVGLGSITRDGFQAMVDYTAPVFWMFLLLVGIGLFILRQRNPTGERPFRVPLYPVTPIFFCLTCAYMLYSSVTYTGYGAMAGLAVVVCGIPLILLRSKETVSTTHET